jgi:multicomponent Na+:H+ antiporter subunit E
MRIVTAALLFALAWIGWSGHYTALLLGLGAISCGLVLWLAARTGFFGLEAYALHLVPRLPRYWAWLIKEIARSNVDVAVIVLSPRMPIEPTLLTIDASHLPPVAQATLANAITLTPGTVSLDIDRGYIEVHCLNRRIAEQLREGEMIRRTTWLAGG